MIHIVTGPPCAGKSTWVSDHAAEADIRVDYDRLAQAFGSSVKHKAPPPISTVAFLARTAVIDAIIEGKIDLIGADVWIIHTSPKAGQLERYAKAGAEIIELDPGVEECLKRAEEDQRPEGTAEAIRVWYERKAEPEPQKGAKTMRKIRDFTITGMKAGPADGLEEGIFEAYASVFGNIDSYGDVVAKGAFVKSLEEWAVSGNTIPCLYGHDMSDPFCNIGGVEIAEEDEHGLKVRVQLDLDNPTAAQVYRLMKGRRLNQMSFAFDVLDSGKTEVNGEKVNELRKLRLYEVSVVPVGANQETEILSVKTHAAALVRGVKEGRVLAAKHIDSLRKAQEAIGEVIAAAEAVNSETSKASPEPERLTSEDPQVKEQEQSGTGHAAAVTAYLKLATLTGTN